MNLNFVAMEA